MTLIEQEQEVFLCLLCLKIAIQEKLLFFLCESVAKFDILKLWLI